MTEKHLLYIILGIFSFGVSLLVKKNKKKSEDNQKKMRDRILQVKRREVFQKSPDFHHPIAPSILKLLEDFNQHKKVGKKLNSQEIKSIEDKLQLSFPESYKIFLKHFGDGGYWTYYQSIDSIQNYSWLKDYRKDLGKTIQLDKKQINIDSLLCLMTEDSNGGAWCWLTSETKKDNEYPLVYYINNKLHYKVENFTEWLNILVQNEGEVIRTLDIEEKLGLG